MEEIVRKAEEYALSEIEKYGLPSIINFETSNKKAEELALKLNADRGIVKIGARLMDIKLGEAKHNGKIEEHIKMSVEASREFLSQFDLPKDKLEKILNCVEGHHGTVNWNCKEAEICANADCYRFLLTKNWLLFLFSLEQEKESFDENLSYALSKLEEKWSVLSLDICKKELESHYDTIKRVIEKVNNEI